MNHPPSTEPRDFDASGPNPETTPSPHCFRFGDPSLGDFSLTTRPLQLWRGEEPVSLQPQPSRLLLLLVEHHGELMSREQIRQELWPDGAFLDHEQAINFAIRKIRIALGDDARAPRFVETVPRLGYRFLAPVEVSPGDVSEAADAEEETAPPIPVDTAPPPAPADRAAPWPLFALLAVVILVPIGVGLERATTPKANLHEEPDFHLVVEAAQAKDGYALFGAPSAAFGRPHESPTGLVGHVADAYLQGRFLVEQDNLEKIRLGITKLRRVVTEDPDFAPGHYALALGFLRQNRDGQHFSSFMPEIEEKVRRALELDPSLAEAHWLLSIVLFAYHHEWDAAERAIRRSMELHGEESAESLRQLAQILAARGKTAEAVRLIRRAVMLDPAEQLVHSDLVLCLMYDRRYGEALEASRTNLEVAPHSKLNLFLDATLRHRLGDAEGALATFHTFFDAWNEPRPATVDEAFDWLIALGYERRSQGRRAYLPLAMLYALTGQAEKSLEMLVEACDHDPHWELPMVGVDPRFDSVRELPGFNALEGCIPTLPS